LDLRIVRRLDDARNAAERRQILERLAFRRRECSRGHGLSGSDAGAWERHPRKVLARSGKGRHSYHRENNQWSHLTFLNGHSLSNILLFRSCHRQ
jgi:hypothetical protein